MPARGIKALCLLALALELELLQFCLLDDEDKVRKTEGGVVLLPLLV